MLKRPLGNIFETLMNQLMHKLHCANSSNSFDVEGKSRYRIS